MFKKSVQPIWRRCDGTRAAARAASISAPRWHQSLGMSGMG
ncbi:hypothetical protein [Sphingopyxis microcysteis]|nr:hypothetical protein [Sphingopyxis microcysteis]